MSGLKIITVWDAITALSVSGLTIKDLNEVTETWDIRGATLYPNITAPLDLQTPQRMSFGTVAGGAKKDVRYTLNYLFAYAPVGSTRGVKDIMSGMFSMLALIFNAVTENDALSGTVDITPRIAGSSTVIQDPAGNSFYGLQLAFDVLEYYEV